MISRSVAALLLLVGAEAFAQQQGAPGRWAKAGWQYRNVNFENAGYMAGDMDTTDTGSSALTYHTGKNAFRDAFAPARSRGFAVTSERFRNTGRWSLYGNFRFARYEDFDVRYASSADPYTDNPYQIVDSLSGDWKKQHYLLETKVLSPRINRYMRAGIGLKYEVLNGARQKDPRPLDKTIGIELVPSVIFQVTGRLTIGVNGYYKRRREDLTISLENHLRSQEIYKLLGLGEYLYNAPVIVSAGISRAYRGNTFGGGLNLGYDLASFSKLRLAMTLKSSSEKAVDGASIPFQAGRHAYTDLGLKMVYLRSSGRTDQSFILAGGYRDIANTEYIQVLNTATQQYDIIHSAEMHHMSKAFADLGYSILWNRKGLPRWILNLEAGIRTWEQRYPGTSGRQSMHVLSAGAGVSRRVALGRGNLEIDYRVSLRNTLDEQLVYLSKSYARNFAANYILAPDHAYHSLAHLGSGADVRYTFPDFGQPFSAYLKAAFSRYQNLGVNEYYPSKAGNNHLSITVGLFN